MSSKSLTVALASDASYIDGLVGTLAGVARHSSAPIQALILDCGINDADWESIQASFRSRFPALCFTRLQIQEQQLASFNPGNRSLRLNNSAYARLLLAELAPEHSKVIYLDSDLMVDADLQPLFDTSLDGALIGAVSEQHMHSLARNIPAAFVTPADAGKPAFNSGVMLMDLNAFRQANLLDKIRQCASAVQFNFQDQAMLNYALKDRWKTLHPRWNRQRFVTENFSIYRDHRGSVWHFIGKMKPWHFAGEHARGLVADFLRNLDDIGWQRRHNGRWRPLSSMWRDGAKSVQAAIRRRLNPT